MSTPTAPASMYRPDEGAGLWEHRGKVAAVGIGHSPTSRRWDGRPETSVGAISLIALRRAIADAGVSPAEIDGLVLDATTTTGRVLATRQAGTAGRAQRVQHDRRSA